MTTSIRYLIFAATNLAVLGNGCAASASEPVALTATVQQCRGGTVSSEAEVAAYGKCRTVSGDLRILQSTLTNLDALSGLRSVSGTLEISGNSQLESLSGLEQLTSVGTLELRGNPELETLKGLEALQSAATVRVEGNGIYDTVGVGNLRQLGTLVVRDNPKLISLRGFKGLERAQSVEIRNNPRLAAYYGLLPQLRQVGEQVVLRSNAGLSKRDVGDLLGRVERGAEQPRLRSASR